MAKADGGTQSVRRITRISDTESPDFSCCRESCTDLGGESETNNFILVIHKYEAEPEGADAGMSSLVKTDGSKQVATIKPRPPFKEEVKDSMRSGMVNGVGDAVRELVKFGLLTLFSSVTASAGDRGEAEPSDRYEYSYADGQVLGR